MIKSMQVTSEITPEQLEKSINELSHSSKMSLILILTGVTVVILSGVYSYTRLSPLQEKINLKEQKIESLEKNYSQLQEKVHTIKTSSDNLSTGINYYHDKEYDLAIKSYSLAIDSYPEHKTAYQLRGQAYLKLGEYDLALNDLNQALWIDANNIRAVYSRSIALAAVGQNEKAAEDLERFFALSPSQRTYNTVMYGGDFSSFREKSKKEYTSVMVKEREKVKMIQQRLHELNYYNSSIDGIPGNKTIKAIKSYQVDTGLDDTGEWNINTISSLGITDEIN